MGTEAGTTDTEPAIGEADYHCSVEVSTNFAVVLIIFRKCASLLKPPTSAVHIPLVKKIGTFVHKHLYQQLLVIKVWSPVTEYFFGQARANFR